MCYPRIFDRRRYSGEIDQAVFDKLIPSLKEFRTISLYGVGEPLVGAKLGVILDNIDTASTLVQFNSNGLLLTEKASRSLIQKKLNLINFSLDAATPETYRKIRRSDFDLVIKNISRLSEIKKERGVKTPVIQINMTLMKENQSEILLFLELARRVGAEIVHLGLLNPFKEYEVTNEGFTFNYRDQMIDPRSEDFRRTIEQAKHKAAEFRLLLLTEFSEYRPL
jgi:MoaA/NifB/PqqE/SkfB family radical SAM enzyme